ncbi:hypothetical protein ABZ904_18660 [Streptomyces sp. NPDC046900]
MPTGPSAGTRTTGACAAFHPYDLEGRPRHGSRALVRHALPEIVRAAAAG